MRFQPSDLRAAYRGDTAAARRLATLDSAADAGVTEVVMGMSHRGRLNVLANIVGKSYAQILLDFPVQVPASALRDV